MEIPMNEAQIRKLSLDNDKLKSDNKDLKRKLDTYDKVIRQLTADMTILKREIGHIKTRVTTNENNTRH